MLRRLRPRLTFANVLSVIALFVALGGSVYAASQINGKSIRKNSIPSNRLKKNSVTGVQVREVRLGQVPRAARAATAASAAQAANAAHANDATTVNGLSVV